MTRAAAATRKDLILLVADKNMEAVMAGLLDRPQSLGIRSISFDIFVHPRRDPGCLTSADDFLRPFSSAYRYALVLFDHEGCGRESTPAETLADEVKTRLENAGWPGRTEVVVLAPELEVWAWTDSPHVARSLGWTDRTPPLREWLADRGYWPPEETKPAQPKAALEAALREVRKPRSSAIYGDLARSVSLKGHTEPAFLRLIHALQRWFSEPATRNP
ncbi:MAG: methylation-associated defense system protein MAD4 [Bryobacteraceae bacterium]